MPTIASRELRNHTASVLSGVGRGEVYTVTVHGRPVAEIRRASPGRRRGVPKSELMALLHHQRPDPALADDLRWITDGMTDEIEDIA